MIKLIAVFLATLTLSFSASADQQLLLEVLAFNDSAQITELVDLEEVKEDAAAEPCQFTSGTGELLLAQGCCRVCRKGKACGNSCINRNYTCHQPRGCACNG